MPASWVELFDRGADYDVTLEDVRTAADEPSTETEQNAETEAGDDA